MPTKNAESVFKITIYKDSLYFPEAIRFKFKMTVLMQLREGPNLSIFLPMAAAFIKDSAFVFFADSSVL